MRTRSILPLAVLVVLASPLPLRPQAEFIGRTEIRKLEWGGVRQGWGGLLPLEGIEKTHGPLGRLDLALAGNSAVVGEETDLLLRFDECARDRVAVLPEPRGAPARYEVRRVDIFPSTTISKFGSCSAGFLNDRHSLQILPLETSLFSAGETLGSFTIDFHLNPAMITDGAVVFSWYVPSVSLDGGYRGIRASFEEGRLLWLFQNLYRRRAGEYVDIRVGEAVSAPLNEWHHHAVSYDADSGLVAVYLDGKESNLAWATEDGKQKGTLLGARVPADLGVPISVGSSYLGYLDELRISRGTPRSPAERQAKTPSRPLEKPPSQGAGQGRTGESRPGSVRFFLGRYRDFGVAKSDVVDLERGLGAGGARAALVKVDWDSEEEHGTSVRVYCRVSDTYFLPTAERNDKMVRDAEGGWEARRCPEWVPVKKGGMVDGKFPAGRYLQWKAELYGTGNMSPFVPGTGSDFTPVLKSLRVHLEPDEPPLPPTLLEAAPLDGGARLTWLKNKEGDLLGYRIYYGSASKYYFGKGADLGDSPATVTGNAGGAVLRGLKNEAVYFVAVTALDAAGQESGFSKELVVRPSQVFGDGDDGP